MQLEECDITRQMLVKIEAGTRHITVQELLTIRKALRTTLDDLFDFDGGEE
jgi:transcriptional regulator with XRE-family HTH domain